MAIDGAARPYLEALPGPRPTAWPGLGGRATLGPSGPGRDIAPVPDESGVEPTERMMTMTTCHPMWSARERYIVHLVFDYWMPVSDGILSRATRKCTPFEALTRKRPRVPATMAWPTHPRRGRKWRIILQG